MPIQHFRHVGEMDGVGVRSLQKGGREGARRGEERRWESKKKRKEGEGKEEDEMNLGTLSLNASKG